MTAATLLMSCWESASRTRQPWSSLGLLLPWSDELDPNALAELPIGERDARLLALRARLFGQRIEALARCPECESTTELTFQVSDVQAKPVAPGRLTVEHRGWRLDFRLPNSNDLAEATAGASVEEARRHLIDRCVVSVSQKSKVRAAGDVPPQLIGLMEDRMAEADPQADVRLKLTCADCGTAWEADVDIGAFVAAEVAAGARRLLREVHRLASVYGWSEEEVLGLAPRRRQAYLELVGTE